MSNVFQNLLSGISKALGTVTGVQTKIATLESEVENDVVSAASGATSYLAGEAVIVSTISIDGHQGKVVALADGGHASVALGLSTAPAA